MRASFHIVRARIFPLCGHLSTPNHSRTPTYMYHVLVLTFPHLIHCKFLLVWPTCAQFIKMANDRERERERAFNSFWTHIHSLCS